ncbi:MAG: acetyl-CoA carboxylase biotin carboxyl carrier protein subunit [Burkholderiales bacterium]|nr:acetyl-CoA carboxylase biotin carboxyl carrier protein subunit [Burkholderiales bacterium]MCE7878577.1 acetyl-CoA carboxylase biotin carboxyl carrier protein subunit [Betaproteobacteria bacterium PRO3]
MSHQVLAPMMGTVVRVDCAAGDSVSPETVVIVIESMKMEVPIESGASGVVSAVRCNVGDLVELDQVLVEIK